METIINEGSLSSRLSDLMKYRNVNEEVLCKDAKINKKTYRDMISGKRVPQVKTLKKIAKVLKTSVLWLRDGISHLDNPTRKNESVNYVVACELLDELKMTDFELEIGLTYFGINHRLLTIDSLVNKYQLQRSFVVDTISKLIRRSDSIYNKSSDQPPLELDEERDVTLKYLEKEYDVIIPEAPEEIKLDLVDLNDVQSRVEFIIDLRGITKTKLSEDSGLASSTIWNLLNNYRSPTPNTYKKLSKGLEVSEDWLKSIDTKDNTPSIIIDWLKVDDNRVITYDRNPNDVRGYLKYKDFVKEVKSETVEVEDDKKVHSDYEKADESIHNTDQEDLVGSSDLKYDSAELFESTLKVPNKSNEDMLFDTLDYVAKVTDQKDKLIKLIDKKIDKLTKKSGTKSIFKAAKLIEFKLTLLMN